MKTMLEWGTAVKVRTTCMASVLGVFRRFSPAILLSLIVAAGSSESALTDSPTAPAMTYPPTRAVDVVDDYFGRKVADPYRWLEDLESSDTAAWVAAQNKVTFAYLEKLSHREAIRKRLTELWDYQRTRVPVLEAGRLWFAQNSGLQRQSPVYRQADFKSAAVQVIDPNALSPDGSLAMAQWSPSPDGNWLAYTLSAGGSDVEDIHLRDLATGKDVTGAVLLHVKFSNLTWTKDSKGFFYSRFKGTETSADFAKANEFHQLWYHTVGAGTPDRLIFERPENGNEIVWAELSDDGRWLFLYASSGTTNNRLWVTDLGSATKPNLASRPVLMAPEEDAIHIPIGVVGQQVYLYTNYRAPKGRIVAARLVESDRSKWQTIVPEGNDAIADARAVLIGDRIAVVYLADVQSRVRLYGLDGEWRGEVSLPEPGSIAEIEGRNDGSEFYFRFSSYLRPATVYRYDLRNASLEAFYPPKSPFDASRYETRVLFYNSRDGTRVPLFVTLRRGAALDGSNPAVLYGYGGFNVAEIPWFSPAVAGWLEMGGVYAVANIRGGSEYGEEWHRAGTRERKQNVFDDFIAAAEYLVAQRYTTPSRLAINGGSNGGLLVAASMIQRPDLFAVVLPEVGVLDMMRYQKFSGGHLWSDDYGSSDDPKAARYLLAYSPLHNLKAGTCYPATLIVTSDRDDRVVPSHSFKFTAALQATQSCSKPTLIRVEVAGSHGYRPTDRLIAEAADIWAFTLANMASAN